jgi:hypothetical protein
MADLDPARCGLPSGNGEAAIVVRTPSAPTAKAETVPAFAPSCALVT